MVQPTVSVIMPAYNAAATIAAALESLGGQDIEEPWELIVVDNNSDDATGDLARNFTDDLPLRVITEKHPGVSAARNAGVAEARSDHLIFADADDLFGPGHIRSMRDALGPNTIVGGWLDRRHLAPDPERRLDDAPVTAIFTGEWLDYPIGCCCAMGRDVFDAIGGFDPNLHYGGEDVDAFWRAQLAGAALVQAGDNALVVRRERANPKQLRIQATAFGRAEASLALRYSAHGHPGRLRKRAWLRALRYTFEVPRRRGAARLEAQRRQVYHGAAAIQLGRYALRIDPKPEAAKIRL